MWAISYDANTLCQQYIILPICYASSILWCQFIIPAICYNAKMICRQYITMLPMSVLPFERPQHEMTGCRFKKRKDRCISKLYFQRIESLILFADALLKATSSKFVFDFDFEILNIPSNFYWLTKEKQRVKWKIETWNVILQLTKSTICCKNIYFQAVSKGLGGDGTDKNWKMFHFLLLPLFCSFPWDVWGCTPWWLRQSYLNLPENYFIGILIIALQFSSAFYKFPFISSVSVNSSENSAIQTYDNHHPQLCSFLNKFFMKILFQDFDIWWINQV